MAISFDNAKTAASSGLTLTTSYTVGSGSNRYLIFIVKVRDKTSDTLTSVTYDSVAMTKVSTVIIGTNVQTMWVLKSPNVGTANLVATSSQSTNFMDSSMASYFGVDQLINPDATNTKATASGSSSISINTTTTRDNCWVVAGMSAETGAGGPTGAGAGTTMRATSLITSIFDSGGPVTPAGVKTLTGTGSDNVNQLSSSISLAPYENKSGFMVF